MVRGTLTVRECRRIEIGWFQWFSVGFDRFGTSAFACLLENSALELDETFPSSEYLGGCEADFSMQVRWNAEVVVTWHRVIRIKGRPFHRASQQAHVATTDGPDANRVVTAGSENVDKKCFT